MTRLTPAREAVISHLRATGETTPSEIAAALGRSPGSTRELLRGMLRDNLLVSKNPGRYRLKADGPDDSPDALTHELDALTHEPDVSPDAHESRIGKPKPGQIFAYSLADGGMIPNAELRRRKGYR